MSVGIGVDGKRELEGALVAGLVDAVEVGGAGVMELFLSGSDVTARMNPFGLSFFLFSLPLGFCFCLSKVMNIVQYSRSKL